MTSVKHAWLNLSHFCRFVAQSTGSVSSEGLTGLQQLPWHNLHLALAQALKGVRAQVLLRLILRFIQQEGKLPERSEAEHLLVADGAVAQEVHQDKERVEAHGAALGGQQGHQAEDPAPLDHLWGRRRTA